MREDYKVSSEVFHFRVEAVPEVVSSSISDCQSCSLDPEAAHCPGAQGGPGSDGGGRRPGGVPSEGEVEHGGAGLAGVSPQDYVRLSRHPLQRVPLQPSSNTGQGLDRLHHSGGPGPLSSRLSIRYEGS